MTGDTLVTADCATSCMNASRMKERSCHNAVCASPGGSCHEVGCSVPEAMLRSVSAVDGMGDAARRQDEALYS